MTQVSGPKERDRALTCQSGILMHAQSQGRDDARQLVQLESSALKGNKESKSVILPD